VGRLDVRFAGGAAGCAASLAFSEEKKMKEENETKEKISKRN
jgi:hypothetical protein